MTNEEKFASVAVSLSLQLRTFKKQIVLLIGEEYLEPAYLVN